MYFWTKILEWDSDWRSVGSCRVYFLGSPSQRRLLVAVYFWHEGTEVCRSLRERSVCVSRVVPFKGVQQCRPIKQIYFVLVEDPALLFNHKNERKNETRTSWSLPLHASLAKNIKTDKEIWCPKTEQITRPRPLLVVATKVHKVIFPRLISIIDRCTRMTGMVQETTSTWKQKKASYTTQDNVPGR